MAAFENWLPWPLSITPLESRGGVGLVFKGSPAGKTLADVGAGTFYPLGKMPLDQALRWYWRAKHFQFSYTYSAVFGGIGNVTGTKSSGASENWPWTGGHDGAQDPSQWPLPIQRRVTGGHPNFVQFPGDGGLMPLISTPSGGSSFYNSHPIPDLFRMKFYQGMGMTPFDSPGNAFATDIGDPYGVTFPALAADPDGVNFWPMFSFFMPLAIPYMPVEGGIVPDDCSGYGNIPDGNSGNNYLRWQHGERLTTPISDEITYLNGLSDSFGFIGGTLLPIWTARQAETQQERDGDCANNLDILNATAYLVSALPCFRDAGYGPAEGSDQINGVLYNDLTTIAANANYFGAASGITFTIDDLPIPVPLYYISENDPTTLTGTFDLQTVDT